MQVCMRNSYLTATPRRLSSLMQHGNEQIDRFIKTLRKKDCNYEYMYMRRLIDSGNIFRYTMD